MEISWEYTGWGSLIWKSERNNSEGRGGAIPSLGEIRNCHINMGTGKELHIKELADLVIKSVGFEGELCWDTSKPNGTPRKLIDVSKLQSLYTLFDFYFVCPPERM